MDKLEIKQGSFIQQTQYFIPVEIDLSVVTARLGIADFFTGIRQTLMSRPGLYYKYYLKSIVPPNEVYAISHPLPEIFLFLNLYTSQFRIRIFEPLGCEMALSHLRQGERYY
jgi:hypothetical protein